MKCFMDHITLNMEDDEKMISFYSQILLLPTERLDEYRAGKVPFPSVRLSADMLIVLFPKKIWGKTARQGEGRENLNHLCIALTKEKWDELLVRLEENAVHIEEGLSYVGVPGETGPRFISGIRKAIKSKRDITMKQWPRKMPDSSLGGSHRRNDND